MGDIYQFGPYGNTHATAGTFAFKRKLLEQTSYDDDAAVAEEKKFLKDYTIPFIQLDPMKTILVFAHEYNTYDKHSLIEKENKFARKTNMKLKTFFKDKKLMEFYMNI